jgi:hypothetical protein
MSVTLPARSALPLLALAAALASPAQAQTAAGAPPAARSAGDAGQRIERIQHEDALTRVEELRVGSETRSITVSPKNGAPAYEIVPIPRGDNPADARNGSAGKSRWPVLSF